MWIDSLSCAVERCTHTGTISFCLCSTDSHLFSARDTNHMALRTLLGACTCSTSNYSVEYSDEIGTCCVAFRLWHVHNTVDCIVHMAQ